MNISFSSNQIKTVLNQTRPTKQAQSNLNIQGAILFTGKRKEAKELGKIQEAFNDFKHREGEEGGYNHNQYMYNSLVGGEEYIQKQLRINEFIGISPKKYLNKKIAKVYGFLEELNSFKENKENLEGITLKDYDAIDKYQRILKSEIARLEKVKEEQFNITEKFDSEGSTLKKFKQKHVGRTSKHFNRASTFGVANIGVLGAMLTFPAIAPFVAIGAASTLLIDNQGGGFIPKKHYVKAYQNEVELTLEEVLPNLIAEGKLPFDTSSYIDIVDKESIDNEKTILYAPTQESVSPIVKAIQSDLRMIKHYLPKNKGVKVMVNAPEQLKSGDPYKAFKVTF